MEIPSSTIFTHDSIGLGEDGPTHQPIEQLAALRAMPDLIVDASRRRQRSRRSLEIIMQLKHEPVALVLTRQALPTFDRTKYGSASGVAKGAYILADAADGKPSVILMATGSEVSLCIAPTNNSRRRNQSARRQHAVVGTLRKTGRRAYRNQVLPPDGESARRGGTGLDFRLVAICRDRREKSSACAASVLPRRSRICRRSSVSPWKTSSPRPANHRAERDSAAASTCANESEVQTASLQKSEEMI